MENKWVRQVLSGVLLVEPNWGVSELSRVRMEMEFVKAGGKYSELGMSERRKAERAEIFDGVLLQDYRGAVVPIGNKDISPGSVAHIKILGAMIAEGGASHVGIRQKVEEIRMVDADDRMEGAVIEFNTGGGQATAGQMLHEAIASMNKPNIAVCSFCASAGYLAASAADEILALGDMAVVGSIGTMAEFVRSDFKDELGENIELIFANTSPDKVKGIREMLDNDDPAEMIRLLDQFDSAFENTVKANRELKGDERDTLNGGVFLARDAKRRGLVDHIGNMERALKILGRRIRIAKRLKRAG